MSLFSTHQQPDFETRFESPAWRDIAFSICRNAGIESTRLERAPSSDHVVYLVDTRFVLKIFRPARNCFTRERKALEFASGRLAFRTPGIENLGNFEGLDYIITTRIPGQPLTRADFLKISTSDQVEILTELAAGLKQLHEMDPGALPDDWTAFIRDRADTFVERQIGHGVNSDIVKALPGFLDANLRLVPAQPTCFLHGDVHFGNLRIMSENGRWRIGGLFDFADSRRGFHEYEFLAVGLLMVQGQRELQREFFKAYGYPDNQLDESMRRRLMVLTMLYETSDLRRYALRLRPEAADYTLDELETAVWSFV